MVEPITTPGTALTYQSNPAGVDTGRYDITDISYAFRGDTVKTLGIADLAALASSPHWEDRIRAEVLRRDVRITLPDQFPCIYETLDSPSQIQSGSPVRYPWVISPDIDMLRALLPDYQELWDAYTSQWGPAARRVFAVGRLDGLKPHSVYRPGTTPETVIASTMLTHTGMYGTAPQRLRDKHPRHTR